MSVRGRLKRSSFFIRTTGRRDMVRIISTDENRGKTQFGKQDFITIWQHEACRVGPDCDFEKRVFLSTPHTYLRDPFRIVFSCISFNSERGNLIMWSFADVCHIVMTLLWRLVTSLCSVTSALTMVYVTSYTTSAHQTRKYSWSLPYPG